MATFTSFQTRALDLARCFELLSDGQKTYYVIRTGSPDWMVDAVRAAHDDELPNDWRYSICNYLTQNIAEHETADAARDNAGELAESQATIYTSELLSWYAERPGRLDYAEQAEETFGHDPGATTGDRLHMGHHYAIEQMVHILISACEQKAACLASQAK